MSISTAPERAGSQQASGPFGRAPDEGYDVLRTLVAVSPTEFRAHHWDRAPLLSRARDLPGSAQQVLTLADVDTLLSERGLRTPFLRVTRDGTIAASDTFTAPGGAGASIKDQISDTLLTDLLLDGSTMVLQGLHRTWRPVIDLVSALSAELAAPVQANAYITPPDSRGFDAHYDVHDVFVVQLAGRKHWQVHAPVHALPLADQPWTDRRDTVTARAAEPPLMEVVLEPGDVLYLPRGTIHAAVTRDALSAHLTLGVHPVTAHAAATAALGLVKDALDLRTSLPPGVGLDTPEGAAVVEDALQALQSAVATLRPEDVAAALAKSVLPQTRPLPLSPLAQAQSVTDMTAATPVRLRRGLQTHLAEHADGSATLITPQRSHRLPVGEVAAIKTVRTGTTVAAGSLPGLATESSLTLSGRLLRLGILVPA